MSSTALDPPAPEGRSASVPRAAFTRPPTRSNTFPSPEIPKAARPVKHATFAADLEQPPPTAASAPPGNIPPNNRNGGAPPMYPPPPPSGPPQQSPSPPKPLAGGIIEVEAYKRQILCVYSFASSFSY
ncbi:hypothetical protein M501DRAFT_1002767 [Patellaria atrata CBS 101060]|uniref:Uncharacterized protein n=1 Tax=Patellaria atrata CBS 101060 TaxID=1346257 RepID=A0A9P4SD48_9PEZI|nr:hypothetical protein M501DRAFT_1002767 [Patellaria atrata CBS 101060]